MNKRKSNPVPRYVTFSLDNYEEPFTVPTLEDIPMFIMFQLTTSSPESMVSLIEWLPDDLGEMVKGFYAEEWLEFVTKWMEESQRLSVSGLLDG